MIQKEFRLICRGIQLISILELDETTKNLTVRLVRQEGIKEPTNTGNNKRGLSESELREEEAQIDTIKGQDNRE